LALQSVRYLEIVVAVVEVKIAVAAVEVDLVVEVEDLVEV